MKKVLHKLNEEIKSNEVRLTGDNIINNNLVCSLSQALKLADELNGDLIEINGNVNPIICKIQDYQKFLYNLKKQEKENKAKSNKVVLKELQFGPHISDNDFNTKLNHAKRFLTEGNKIKAIVSFKGRDLKYTENGQIVLLKLANSLSDIGIAESLPKLEGKKMIMIIKPKK